MLVAVYHLGSLRDFNEFFKQEVTSYELKTTLASIQPVKIDILRDNANDMIAELIRLHEDKRSLNIPDSADLNIDIKQQLALMNFCLQNINIKKLNIELW